MGALEEMVEVVDTWNGYLEPSKMFLALIRFDGTLQEGLSTSAYSLYLGSKELVRMGVRTADINCRLSRLTLKCEGDKFELHESDFPEILGLVARHDGVLRSSDDGYDGDEERPTEDSQ